MVNYLFKALFEKSPAGIPVGDLRDALKNYPQKGNYTQTDVANIIQTAGKASPHKPQQKREVVLDIDGGPRQEIDCDQICDILEPYVRKARELLFGSDHETLDEKEVEGWIQAQLDADPNQGWFEAELKKSGAENIYPGHRQERFLRWLKRSRPSMAGMLSTTAAKSGFPEGEILQWILTDVRPKLPKLRLTQSRKFPAGTRDKEYFSFHLVINSRDIGWDEMRSVFMAIRGPKRRKKSQIDPMHHRIYSLVREQGGPPSDWDSQFWEKIRKKLVKEKKWKVPDTWNAIAKAYHKLVAHL